MTTKKKVSVVSKPMTVNTYKVLSEAIEDGIGYGYMRAHKYVAKPDEETMREAIYNAVMNSISENFSFGDEGE